MVSGVDASIVLCTYNRSGTLAVALDSLARMGLDAATRPEIVVVDNNSTDETAAVVRRHAQHASCPVRYLFEPQQGKSHALNAGVRAAKGEIVAFTDDDITVHPDWLSQLIQTFDTHACMGVGGRIVPVWSAPRPSWLCTTGPHRLMQVIVEFDMGDEPSRLAIPPFGANMAVRRSAFEKHGLFRVDLGPTASALMRGEDTEFMRRLIAAGDCVMYEPRAVVYHPVEPERATKRYFAKWYFDYGKSVMRATPIAAGTVCYGGVPRHLFRGLVEQAVRWAFALGPRRRFYYKLRTHEAAGHLAEAFRRSRDRA